MGHVFADVGNIMLNDRSVHEEGWTDSSPSYLNSEELH